MIRRIAPCNDTLLPLEHFYLPPSIYLSFLLLLGAHYSLHQPQQVIARSPTRGTTEQSHPLPTLPPRGGGKGWGGIATPFGLAMTDSELWKCKLFHAPLNKGGVSHCLHGLFRCGPIGEIKRLPCHGKSRIQEAAETNFHPMDQFAMRFHNCLRPLYLISYKNKKEVAECPIK